MSQLKFNFKGRANNVQNPNQRERENDKSPNREKCRKERGRKIDVLLKLDMNMTIDMFG